VDNIDAGLANIGKLFLQGFHYLNRNTEKGSRRNIAAHYDLGNDMFELFLDPTMMYSSGIFPSDSASMEEASLYKLDRICQKLRLNADDHLLEIGTGWGSMRSEEHTSELQSRENLVCRLLLEKKKQ